MLRCLRSGAAPEERSRSRFYVDSAGIVDALVRHGADVNAKDNDGTTPLHIACGATLGHLDVIECLLRHGARVDARDADGNTPLLAALEGDYISDQPIEILVKYGADVNAQDYKEHASPLMIACDAGETLTTGALLRHGASVNLRDKNGHTALWRAKQQYRSLDLVPILEKAGATL